MIWKLLSLLGILTMIYSVGYYQGILPPINVIGMTITNFFEEISTGIKVYSVSGASSAPRGTITVNGLLLGNWNEEFWLQDGVTGDRLRLMSKTDVRERLSNLFKTNSGSGKIITLKVTGAYSNCIIKDGPEPCMNVDDFSRIS